MSLSRIDILIIGQGFAGSLLARALIRRGLEVVVVDDAHRSSSSHAAAGLINPLPGRQLARNPRIAQFLAAAGETYGALEHELGTRLLYFRPMVRLAPSAKDQDRWRRRIAEDAGYLPYVDGEFEAGRSGLPLNDGFGGLFQTQTGHIVPDLLLNGMRAAFEREGRLREVLFRPESLEAGDGRVRWCDITASRVIFCDGYKGAANSWFSWLPFRPVKGEILTLEGDLATDGRIVNGGKWLLPVGNGYTKLGATYDRGRTDEVTTDEARQVLLNGLAQLLQSPPPVQVVEQRAGVRPGTRDRAPFIGCHPHHSEICIFNGFGSKGSLMIPWYAERLADHLLEGRSLPAEANIARYPHP